MPEDGGKGGDMLRSKTIAAAGIGALLAYLFDPVSGRGRRTRMRDQLMSAMRKSSEAVERRARYERGRVEGAVHEVRRRGKDLPRDDAELLQKIRSEALGPSGAGDVVEALVDRGKVTLRGNIYDEEIRRDLTGRVSRVTGVDEVHFETPTGADAR
jgi:osmotically-inducible protein OsmY